jgi:hypothetical protein
MVAALMAMDSLFDNIYAENNKKIRLACAMHTLLLQRNIAESKHWRRVNIRYTAYVLNFFHLVIQ